MIEMEEHTEKNMSADEVMERIGEQMYHGHLVVFHDGWPITCAPLHVMIELLHQRLILETAPTEGRKPS